MTRARYDDVADFYEAGWTDSYDDPVSVAFFDLLGAVGGLHVLDVACGHGRLTRELARRQAVVVGVDLSGALIEKAEAIEKRQPLGVTYRRADISSDSLPVHQTFDVVTCSFGLSDIDDLDGCIAAVGRMLRAGGRFVFSFLHPCFSGDGQVSGSWPSTRTYYDQGWWAADGLASSLRRQVGANHRTLSTYVNALGANRLHIDAADEPRPPQEWSERHSAAARLPVYLVVRCLKS